MNQLASLSYEQWQSGYHSTTIRQNPSYSWMDWSQDGCSAGALGFRKAFLYGCLRHDFSWRTMAVLEGIDGVRGRIWNERNRHVADVKFKNDNFASCEEIYPEGDRESSIEITSAWLGCRTGAIAFYNLILIPYRSATTSEVESVDDNPSFIAMPASVCSYASNPSNRCLPINYVELDGKPFAPQNISRIPTDKPIALTVVRANLQSEDGPQTLQGLTYRRTGDLRLEASYPLVVKGTKDIDCADHTSGNTYVYADSDDFDYWNPVNDTLLKKTQVYVKSCRATDSGETDDALLELHPMITKWRYSHQRYMTVPEVLRVRHYENINAVDLSTSLSPDPSVWGGDLALSSAGAWSSPIRSTPVPT